jgi:hypothetical protein
MANSELKDRVFDVPKNVMDFLSMQQDIPELDRNENLRKTGNVTYGQLKRILHDMKGIKMSKPNVYNFYGGDLMWNWGKGTLERERNQINNRQESEKISNDISGLSGERKNPSLKRHTKNTVSPKVGINMVSKPNSEKYTNAGMFSAKSMKLFEEISRIKKLMT